LGSGSLFPCWVSVGERQAGFRSLKDSWADTTTAHGRLMLTVLGGLAEFERRES
jgi:DNA invertase Pin-like site-specific DNA recombinase